MKTCGDCTKCCEGTLKLTINGNNVSPGNPCVLLTIGKGCSDYENRPYMPCKFYKCGWLKNQDIPNEFIPNKVNIILHEMWNGKIKYHTLLPTQEDILDKDVSDIFLWHQNNNNNFHYIHKQIEYVCGEKDFVNKYK